MTKTGIAIIACGAVLLTGAAFAGFANPWTAATSIGGVVVAIYAYAIG